MTSELEAKVAVVTGAAGGLGAFSALRLSREGCRR
jgi:NAD(P)-dependent dehydrogenase (short-subunit alcohol dehydrogenase family)